jgi:hypothetical protein
MLKSGTQSIYLGRRYANTQESRIPKMMSTVLPRLGIIVPTCDPSA